MVRVADGRPILQPLRRAPGTGRHVQHPGEQRPGATPLGSRRKILPGGPGREPRGLAGARRAG